VLDPGDLPDVLDVVGDLAQRGPRPRVRRLPLGGDRVGLGEVPLVEPAPADLGHQPLPPVGALLGDERGDERDHADPAVPGQRAEHVVGDVARVPAHLVRGGVGEDHRLRRDGERVPHGVGRRVGQVDKHADPLHLPDDVPAEVGEPAGGRLVGARVGPADVRVVGERQVAHAERLQHPQHAERGVDRVPALGAHQRGDPARRHDPPHVPGVQRDLEVVRIPLGQPVHQVDLLQHGGDGGRARQRVRDVHRPELGADPTGPQPRQVGLQLGNAGGQVDPPEVAPEVLAHRPGQVVVPVQHRRAGHPAGMVVAAHRPSLVPSGPGPDIPRAAVECRRFPDGPPTFGERRPAAGSRSNGASDT